MDWIHIEPEIQSYTITEKAALSMLNDGKSYFQIAYKLHCSFERAKDIIYDIRRKESIRMARLTNTERAAIYQAWKDGTTQKELAKQYGVCAQAISQLCAKLAKAEQEIMQPAAEDKPKPGIINPEFDAAVDAMIAESKSADAEEPAAIVEPDKLPPVVRRAIDDQISEYEFQICERDSRIEELKDEIAEFRKDIDALREWKEQHT